MLDLVITCSENPVTDLQVIDYDLSDHSLVNFIMHTEHRVLLNESTHKCVCDFKQFDAQRFITDFVQQDLNTNSSDPNELFTDTPLVSRIF